VGAELRERQEAELVALKSAILVLYLQAGRAAHLAADTRCHPDELARKSEVASSPLPCELVEGTAIRSCFSVLSAVRRCHRRLIRTPVSTE
jgi:hypothetical protein